MVCQSDEFITGVWADHEHVCTNPTCADEADEHRCLCGAAWTYSNALPVPEDDPAPEPNAEDSNGERSSSGEPDAGLCDAGRKRLATEVIAAPDTEANIVRRVVNAWDCCGTCAGGVLANHVRAAVETERERVLEFVHTEWFNGNIGGRVSDRIIAAARADRNPNGGAS